MADSTGRRCSSPVVLWDVDGVFNPRVPTSEHVAHVYDGPGPTGHVTGTVCLNPVHATWLAELTAAGVTHAWASSWGQIAASWIAPRLGHPPAENWPVLDISTHGGVRWGHSHKFGPIVNHIGDRPACWVDDEVGGKDLIWAEDRTGDGIPTRIQVITAPTGLTRPDVDTILHWLAKQECPSALPS